MKQRKDILLTEDNDLRIENGDFVVGFADMQHVDHILKAHPGEYKEHPQIGVGVQKYLKTTGQEQKLKRELRIQLAYDGYNNPKISLSDTFNLEIDL